MKRFLCKKAHKNTIFLFMIRFKTKLIVKNNPGSNRPVFFWFKIPAEDRVCPSARRHAQDPIDTQAL